MIGCTHDKTKVLETRINISRVLRTREIIRVRECKDCTHRFITKEIPVDKATETGHITVTDTTGVTTMYCSSGYRKKYANRRFIDG